MFDWYGTISMYYQMGIYTAEQVQVFVGVGWITPEQAQEITGPPPEPDVPPDPSVDLPPDETPAE